MTRNTVPARTAFERLGIPETDWTPTMRLAVKQKWTNLPVDEKVADLRARLAAVVVESTPTAADLAAAGHGTKASGTQIDLPACEKEAARLKRNAGVNAWRTRGQIQAALDARELRFAALRAKRAPRVSEQSAVAV